MLVIPMPATVRHFIAKKILRLNLAKRIQFLLKFITLGLILAVWDAIQQLQHLDEKVKSGQGPPKVGDLGNTVYVAASLDRQRKFRAERNLYLAGFTLVLLFVIARIVELLNNVVQLEEERDSLKRRLSAASGSGSKDILLDNATPTAGLGLRRRRGAVRTAS